MLTMERSNVFWCLMLSSTLKMVAVLYCVVLVHFCHTTKHYIPDIGNLHIHVHTFMIVGYGINNKNAKYW